jgi:hypothetical protein
MLIAIPLSLEIGVAINASPHRQAIVVFMVVLLALRHHKFINSLPDTIESWMYGTEGNKPKNTDSSDRVPTSKKKKA